MGRMDAMVSDRASPPRLQMSVARGLARFGLAPPAAATARCFSPHGEAEERGDRGSHRPTLTDPTPPAAGEVDRMIPWADRGSRRTAAGGAVTHLEPPTPPDTLT